MNKIGIFILTTLAVITIFLIVTTTKLEKESELIYEETQKIENIEKISEQKPKQDIKIINSTPELTPTPEPVPEPIIEVIVEQIPEPTPEQTPEPQPEPEPEPIIESIPEPVPEENTAPSMTYYGNCVCTWYIDTGSNCANGNYPTPFYSAANNELPFGTKIYIEGLGYFVVEDRGSHQSIDTEKWIDVYVGTMENGYALGWGERNFDVYIVE